MSYGVLVKNQGFQETLTEIRADKIRKIAVRTSKKLDKLRTAGQRLVLCDQCLALRVRVVTRTRV